jgi:hypothetical protein
MTKLYTEVTQNIAWMEFPKVECVISFFKTVHNGCLLKAGPGLVGNTVLITNIP